MFKKINKILNMLIMLELFTFILIFLPTLITRLTKIGTPLGSKIENVVGFATVLTLIIFSKKNMTNKN